MKLFLAGFLAACTIAVVIYVTFPDRFEPSGGHRAEAPGSDAGSPPAPAWRGVPTDVTSQSRTTAVEREAAQASRRTAAHGTVELRVGEGCDLATGDSIPIAAGEQGADFTCADINSAGVTIECPGGVLEAKLPAIWVGRRPSKQECFDLVKDAPEAYTDRVGQLRWESERRQSGVALVKARNDQPYKLVIVAANESFRVLERTVTIRFEPVPAASDGGCIRLEGQLESTNLDEVALEALRKILKRPAVPADTFRGFVGSAFEGVKTLPDKFDLPPDTHLALASTLDGELTIEKGNGSVFLSKGVGRRGKVKVKTYAGILVEGDVDGDIEVNSYGYLHVTGNLNGTLTCNSYATVLIDGDVRGQFRARSYVKLLVGGRFTDPASGLDAASAGWSTFYLRSYTSRFDIEAFPPATHSTLHVRDSDLPPGKHEHVGRWKEVIVAAPLWQTL